jgi:hypothetical protein
MSVSTKSDPDLVSRSDTAHRLPSAVNQTVNFYRHRRIPSENSKCCPWGVSIGPVPIRREMNSASNDVKFIHLFVCSRYARIDQSQKIPFFASSSFTLAEIFFSSWDRKIYSPSFRNTFKMVISLFRSVVDMIYNSSKVTSPGIFAFLYRGSVCLARATL